MDTYLKVIKQKIGEQDEISSYAKHNHYFNIGDVSYSEFDNTYKETGWLGRKIISIPSLAVGLIKAIYHLALTIIVGIPAAICDSDLYLKVKLFCIVRDLQESCGWLITFFYDSYGQYLVQDSLFHKSAYECFFLKSEDPKPNLDSSKPKPPTPNKPEIPSKPKSPHIDSTIEHAAQKPLNNVAEADQEFDRIRSGNYDQRQIQYYELAERCLSVGFLGEALKSIDEVSNTSKKDAFYIRLSEAYLLNDETEKSLDLIKNKLFGYESKNPIYLQLAEYYFKKEDYEKGLEAIKKVYSNEKVKQDYILKTAEAYLLKDDQENAVITIEGLSDSKVKQTFLTKVAESYLESNPKEGSKIIYSFSHTNILDAYWARAANRQLALGNNEKAIEYSKEIRWDDDCKKTIVLKASEAYFKEEKFDSALHTLKDFSDGMAKQNFILKIAEAYLLKSDQENAIATIEEHSDTKIKETFLTKVAESYLESDPKRGSKILYPFSSIETLTAYWVKAANRQLTNGNKEKAIEYSNEIHTHRDDAKNKIVLQAAEAYFMEENFDAALNALKKIHFKNGKKALIIQDIIKAYIKKGDANKAYDVLNSSMEYSNEKSFLRLQIAFMHYSKNDNANALKVMKDIVEDYLYTILIEKNYDFSRYYLMTIFNSNFKEFLNNLATTCFELTKDSFNPQNSEVILNMIKNKCSEQSILDTYLSFNTTNQN